MNFDMSMLTKLAYKANAINTVNTSFETSRK